MMDWKGKVALVTGASRGIGRDTALALARKGASIALNYNKSEKEAKDVAREIRQTGSRCIELQADVSNGNAVEEMINSIRKSLGPIQILINNAGISRPLKLEEISEKEWDQTIDINLKSAFLITQAVLPDMRSQKYGRIVNISSVAAQLGGVVGPHYAASKAGMIGLTHSYANLLSKEGITVNAIAPALIATEMVARNPNATVNLIPVGRLGKVEEVTDVVLMLVENGYITGQTINVNGGRYMS
jgi:3-oxoacyl-[acyl-carrier protein] reductase